MSALLKLLQMRIRKPLCILPLCCLLPCCTFQDTITGVPYGSAKVVYERGSTSLISTKKHSVKVIPPPAENYAAKTELPFVVVVRNNSNATFDFRPSRISAKWESKKWKNPPRENVVVYDYAQILKKLKNRQGAATFLALLGGAAGAYNAAQAGTTTTYGHVGNTPFSATSYNSGLSTALAVQNANQTASNLNQISRSADQAKSDLGRFLLRRQTMPPKSTYGGQLIIENPWDGPFDQWGGKFFLTVPIGNEIHKFAFQVDTNADGERAKWSGGSLKQKDYNGTN